MFCIKLKGEDWGVLCKTEGEDWGILCKTEGGRLGYSV